MNNWIHDEEADTGERSARSLLDAQCPQWAEADLSYLAGSGTSNSIWRITTPAGTDDLVMRLPRTAGAAQSVAKELALLPELATALESAPFDLPAVRHAGEPTADYPYPWAVFDWIDGDDAWVVRDATGVRGVRFVDTIVRAVTAIGSVAGVDAPRRESGGRGGPVRPLLDRLEGWLADPGHRAPELVDVDAVRRSAAESMKVADEAVDIRFVHGDLIPGNVILRRGRLAAVIDWGSAGYADRAQDLAPARSLFDRADRERFREAMDVGDAAWLRARAFELEHAVGGVLYYAPRGHELADVMARTLRRILEDE